MDAEGDVVVVGSYSGTIDFGGGLLTSQGNIDIFVLKLSGSDGSYLWAKRFGAGNADTAWDVEIAANNEIVVTGTIRSNVDFGAGPLGFAGDDDIFLARFTSAGAVLWAKSYGTGGNDRVNDMALDSLGSPVLVGEHPGPIDFGGGFLPHVGLEDIFIVKLSP